jgi:hypothetical protein
MGQVHGMERSRDGSLPNNILFRWALSQVKKSPAQVAQIVKQIRESEFGFAPDATQNPLSAIESLTIS